MSYAYRSLLGSFWHLLVALFWLSDLAAVSKAARDQHQRHTRGYPQPNTARVPSSSQVTGAARARQELIQRNAHREPPKTSRTMGTWRIVYPAPRRHEARTPCLHTIAQRRFLWRKLLSWVPRYSSDLGEGAQSVQGILSRAAAAGRRSFAIATDGPPGVQSSS
jgi:hypothetical protein